MPDSSNSPIGMTVRSRLAILAAAALFSTGGAAIKACTLSGWQLAGFRSAVAALAVWALVPAARKRWSLRTLGVGAAYAATMISFVLSNKHTTSANAIFLQSTAPLYILVLAPWILKERIRPRDLIFMAALAAGLGMFFLGNETASATAPDPVGGNLIAAVSGVFWALTVMGLRGIARHDRDSDGDSAVAVLAGNVIAIAVCFPMSYPFKPISLSDALVVGYLGVFQIGLAYVCLTVGMRHVPALEASLLLLAEPVLNPVWAWLVHGERPAGWALAGGALILVATAARTWIDARS